MRGHFTVVSTDILEDFTEDQLEKLRVHGNTRKGINSIRTGFFASRDAEFCIPKIPIYLGHTLYIYA